MAVDLEGIIAAVEEAAFTPAALPGLFEHLASVTGSESALMFSLTDGRPDLFGCPRAIEIQRCYAREGWATQDVLTPAIKRLAPGSARLSHQFIDPTFVRSHPFFQEFLRVHAGGVWGVGWHCTIEAELFAFLFTRKRPFSETEAALFSRLAPRVQRSRTAGNAAACSKRAQLCRRR